MSETVLADGTRIWLDSGSAADFEQTESTRTLDIARGRIHVAIAKDSARPFIVRTDTTNIRDIGTAFTVDEEPEGLSVSVSEGAVEVSHYGDTTRINAGSSAVFASGPGRAPRQVAFKLSADAAWRNGRILLDNTTLEGALREADRYWPGKIVLLDASAARRPVSGSLSITDLDASLSALADSQGLELTRLPMLLLVTEADR